MQLNILTRTQGADAAKPYPIALDDFWRLYFRMLNTIGITINQREEDVLSYILSRVDSSGNIIPLGTDYFTGDASRQMREDLKLARSEVTRLKQALRAKRIINDHDNQPVAAFVNIHKYLMHNKELFFIFPLKIA